jgi:DNA-binding NarL/FixJ family response regulator
MGTRLTAAGRRLRVLLVEDDHPLRALQKIVLEETGRFRVAGEAEDGRQAIRLAGTLQPDVVLLDLAMPVMGGLEALPRIREVAPASQVVIVTMMQREGTEAEALRLGATAYLDKGLDSVEFVARLERALGAAPGADRRSAAWARTPSIG